MGYEQFVRTYGQGWHQWICHNLSYILHIYWQTWFRREIHAFPLYAKLNHNCWNGNVIFPIHLRQVSINYTYIVNLHTQSIFTCNILNMLFIKIDEGSEILGFSQNGSGHKGLHHRWPGFIWTRFPLVIVVWIHLHEELAWNDNGVMIASNNVESSLTYMQLMAIMFTSMNRSTSQWNVARSIHLHNPPTTIWWIHWMVEHIESMRRTNL